VRAILYEALDAEDQRLNNALKSMTSLVVQASDLLYGDRSEKDIIFMDSMVTAVVVEQLPHEQFAMYLKLECCVDHTDVYLSTSSDELARYLLTNFQLDHDVVAEVPEEYQECGLTMQRYQEYMKYYRRSY
jgi:hypothetical protein